LKIKFKIIIIAILVPIIIYFWPAILGGNTEFLIVQGNSMLPTILPGSFIIAQKQPSYEIDDIVGFVLKERGPQRVVVHRIITEDERGFRMQGDNNPKGDIGFYSNQEILGKVAFVVPYLGDAIGLARNPIVLIVSAVGLTALQMEQKRRKKIKERIRRIKYGLPKIDTEEEKLALKPKKPEYTLFYGALAFNILVYVLIQIQLLLEIPPQGDMLTGFLFRSLESSFASTVIMGFYFVMMFIVYFVAKFFERRHMRPKRRRPKKSAIIDMLFGKGSNPIHSGFQFIWLIFILLSAFHVSTIVPDLVYIWTCDPTVDLDCR
jgi:signal peptidase I